MYEAFLSFLGIVGGLGIVQLVLSRDTESVKKCRQLLVKSKSYWRIFLTI